MRRLKEVLRLRFAGGLYQEQIARSCSIGQATVHRYLKRAEAAGLSWPLPDDYDDDQLEALLFPEKQGRRPGECAGPDFGDVHRQMAEHRHLTLQLLWEEYREVHPSGYGYSRFCELYHEWKRGQDVVLRQEHRPGEKTFVDWAGPTIPIHDPQTGETRPASLFVAVLGASSYTFVRAASDQGLANWIDCHVHAFEFFDGTTQLIIPDNPRTGVNRACRYEPDLNRTYLEMSQHYGTAILPARPYKPRDKAKVESAVLLAERWIIAVLRHRKFFSLAELNDAIEPLLERLNHRPFRKRDGCRASLYASLDRPVLQALPVERYVMADWVTVRPSIDYHVEVERHYYSVPYRLAGQSLEARYTAATVEIFKASKRIASHARSYAAYHHTTDPAHRPKSHQAHLEWTPSRLIHWASSVGPATAEVVRTIMESRPHPEQGYRACLGIMRLAKTYSPERVEAASRRALHLHACSYTSLRSMLKRSLDQQTTADEAPSRPGPEHENLRGSGYYDSASVDRTALQNGGWNVKSTHD
jgi:transposase